MGMEVSFWLIKSEHGMFMREETYVRLKEGDDRSTLRANTMPLKRKKCLGAFGAYIQGCASEDLHQVLGDRFKAYIVSACLKPKHLFNEILKLCSYGTQVFIFQQSLIGL